MRFLLSRRLLLKFREKRRTWKRGGVGGQAAEKSAECPIAQLPAYDAPLSAEHAPGVDQRSRRRRRSDTNIKRNKKLKLKFKFLKIEIEMKPLKLKFLFFSRFTS